MARSQKFDHVAPQGGGHSGHAQISGRALPEEGLQGTDSHPSSQACNGQAASCTPLSQHQMPACRHEVWLRLSRPRSWATALAGVGVAGSAGASCLHPAPCGLRPLCLWSSRGVKDGPRKEEPGGGAANVPGQHPTEGTVAPPLPPRIWGTGPCFFTRSWKAFWNHQKA